MLDAFELALLVALGWGVVAQQAKLALQQVATQASEDRMHTLEQVLQEWAEAQPDLDLLDWAKGYFSRTGQHALPKQQVASRDGSLVS